MNEPTPDDICNQWIPRRDADRRIRLLGILNLTPDSFYDGGQNFHPDEAIRRAFTMVAEGADALDLGAESTRPGAEPVSAEEELRRLVPVLRAIRHSGIPISVDTSKAHVAAEALREGATLVNDVTALAGDSEMAEVCARARCAVILMHMRGTPRTMQHMTNYEDVVGEIADSLRRSVDRALAAGIDRDRIFVDPGIGFAKTAEQNLEILRRIHELQALGQPLVLGASRKSFLSRFGGEGPAERLPATIAVSALASRWRVQVLRVHDVRENAMAVKLAESVTEAERPTTEATC